MNGDVGMYSVKSIILGTRSPVSSIIIKDAGTIMCNPFPENIVRGYIPLVVYIAKGTSCSHHFYMVYSCNYS